MQTEIIKLWKEHNVSYAEMEFSCGGDSMNDFSFYFYDKNDKVLATINELDSYFENQVFNEVQFYEASDGHYQGEFGKVVIELDDTDEDEEEHHFTYNKQAQSEWSETYSEVITIDLSDKEVNILKEFVNNINGGDVNYTFNYKKDFIMTDDIEKTLNDLGKRIDEECRNYEFVDVEGEYSEWYQFTTDTGDTNETNDLIIEGNTLKVQTNQQYNVVRDSED